MKCVDLWIYVMKSAFCLANLWPKYGTMAVWYCATVPLCHSRFMPLWHCGSMHWHCGAVALWHLPNFTRCL